MTETAYTMDGNTAVEIIKRRFQETDDSVLISAQGEGFFTAKIKEDGIEVDNLSTQPFLPWEVFIETVNLLNRKGGGAKRGELTIYRLGDVGLELDTVEGQVAHVVYGKQIGENISHRIISIAALLIWAGICDSAPGALTLQ